MERRNHERVAVNLKAALVDGRAMPIGCRVRDVSSGGMLLQHERYDKATTFQQGDIVEVRVSLKQGEERKVIPLPMTVKRVEENGIGAEFLEPQPQLMTLVEPYRLDKEETREVVANQGGGGVAAASTASPLSARMSSRASRRRSAIQRARSQFAESMNATPEPAPEKKQPVVEQTPGGNFFTGKGDRSLFYIGLLSLVAAVGILLLGFADRTHIETRMSALESNIDRQVNTLTLLRARLGSTETRTNELAELNARVETLATSFAALEARFTPDADQATTLSTTAAASIPGILPGTAQPANDKPASETLSNSTAPAQLQGSSSEGLWVINLLSLNDESAANRFTEKARTQGIPADINQIAVKGQQVWRIQVSGFSTRDEASAFADTSKKKLGLNSVWIFKKGR